MGDADIKDVAKAMNPDFDNLPNDEKRNLIIKAEKLKMKTGSYLAALEVVQQDQENASKKG